MIWQDIAMALLNILTGYALIPQVYHGFKTKSSDFKLQTLIITNFCIFSFAIIFATLEMILSASICLFSAIMWAILLIQRIKYPNPKS